MSRPNSDRHDQTYKIDSNGGDVGLRVGIIGESQQETGLSDTGVSDKQEFEEIIAAEREKSNMMGQKFGTESAVFSVNYTRSSRTARLYAVIRAIGSDRGTFRVV